MSGPGRRHGPGQAEPPNAVQPPVRPRSWAEGRLEVEVERRSVLGPRAWGWKLIGAVDGATLPMTVAAGWGWTVQQAERRGRRAARNVRAVKRAAGGSRFEV